MILSMVLDARVKNSFLVSFTLCKLLTLAYIRTTNHSKIGIFAISDSSV